MVARIVNVLIAAICGETSPVEEFDRSIIIDCTLPTPADFLVCERIIIFLAASGERSWGRHTVHFRTTAGGRRGFLPAELFPTRPGRCGGRPHLLHQFRQDRQPERAAQDRVGRLRHAEGEDAIPRSHLGTI